MLTLAQSLYARRNQAVVIPFVEMILPSGPPSENDCHGNVDRWVRQHPGDRALRGWLVFDNFLMTRVCRFNAHSVVEAADGSLFDLTPSKASRRYPFLRHVGRDGEFTAMIDGTGLVYFDYDPDENKVYPTFAASAG